MENSIIAKYPGTYLSVPESLVSLEKRKPHIWPKWKKKNSTVEQIFRMVVQNATNDELCEKKMPVANCQQAIFGGERGGPNPGSLPTEFT